MKVEEETQLKAFLNRGEFDGEYNLNQYDFTEGKTITAVSAAIHPIDTYNIMKDAIHTSYVINGDAESRAQWFSYAGGIIITSAVGTKGAGTVTKAGTATVKTGIATAKTKIGNMEFSNQFGRNPELALEGGNIPYNVYDGDAVKNQRLQFADNFKGLGKDYKNYKDIEYTGTTKVNGKVRDTSRRVFQRVDIDYKRIDPDSGLTNFQLMKKGRAPIWKDGTVIELHHLIQREPGSMVELPHSLHKEYDKILHGLVENGNSFRNDPVLHKQYINFRRKYWRWRAEQIDKNEL